MGRGQAMGSLQLLSHGDPLPPYRLQFLKIQHLPRTAPSGASEEAQQVKTIAANPSDSSSIPRADRKVEEKGQLHRDIL